MWLVSSCCFCFKQKTAYEMRISDWSSDVCSSDLAQAHPPCRLLERGAVADDAGREAPEVIQFHQRHVPPGHRRIAGDVLHERLLAAPPLLLLPGVAAADRERQIVGKLVGALGIDGGRARQLIVAEHEGIVVTCAIGRCRSNTILETRPE